MRLLINAVPLLGESSGIGTYTRHIAHALATATDMDTTFFYGYPSKKLVRSQKGSPASFWLGQIKSLARTGVFARKSIKKAFKLAALAHQALRPQTYDCYFEPNFVPLPTVRANHTVLAMHDFSCFRFPQWHPQERVRYMETNFWASAEKADLLITGAEAIRQEAIVTFGLAPSRVVTIHHGVDRRLFQPAPDEARQSLLRRYGLPENFILYVGTIEPRKNLRNLLMAHASLPAPLRMRFPLVLIGAQGWKNDGIMNLIRANSRSIYMLGYVPRADLPVFYSAAAMFVYPSWYEGFGLPVLEAMACGCPPVISTDPAMCEVCENAALRAAPDDIEAIAQCMRNLLEDAELRSQLSGRALERARDFDLETSTHSHLRLFRQVCGLY